MEEIAPVSTRTRPILWLLIGVAGVGALIVLTTAGASGIRAAGTLGKGWVMLLAGGLGAAFVALWMRNARLLVGADTFGFQDVLGRRRTWSASEVAAIVQVTLTYGKLLSSQQAVYVIGLDGRRLLALNLMAWSASSIDRLARAAGKPVKIYSEPITVARFRREYPRVIGSAYEHPWVLGAGLGLVMLVPVLAIPIALLILNR